MPAAHDCQPCLQKFSNTTSIYITLYAVTTSVDNASGDPTVRVEGARYFYATYSANNHFGHVMNEPVELILRGWACGCVQHNYYVLQKAY
jgi:hypothetical protein